MKINFSTLEVIYFITEQDFEFMEIVISDDQGNEEIGNICAKFRDGEINIQYGISGYVGDGQ